MKHRRHWLYIKRRRGWRLVQHYSQGEFELAEYLAHLLAEQCRVEGKGKAVRLCADMTGKQAELYCHQYPRPSTPGYFEIAQPKDGERELSQPATLYWAMGMYESDVKLQPGFTPGRTHERWQISLKPKRPAPIPQPRTRLERLAKRYQAAMI